MDLQLPLPGWHGLLNNFISMRYIILLLLSILAFGACSSDLDIKQAYLFSIKTLPVAKRIQQGETVALEFTLVRESNYKAARYSFRYFQPEGEGRLMDASGRALTMNRFHSITDEEFTLLYRSACKDAQQLDFVFIDNFGQEVEYVVSFQNKTKEDN